MDHFLQVSAPPPNTVCCMEEVDDLIHYISRSPLLLVPQNKLITNILFLWERVSDLDKVIFLFEDKNLLCFLVALFALAARSRLNLME